MTGRIISKMNNLQYKDEVKLELTGEEFFLFSFRYELT